MDNSITLELKINGSPDNRIFLNFWDSVSANDVCCEIIKGKLILDTIAGEREITLTEFINLVKMSNSL